MASAPGDTRRRPDLGEMWQFRAVRRPSGPQSYLALARLDLLRSWASDVMGAYHPDYVWDDLAQVWQTPGDGEKDVETLMSGTVEDRAERMREFGVPGDTAVQLAEGQGVGRP
jgi:hypothetical protein